MVKHLRNKLSASIAALLTSLALILPITSHADTEIIPLTEQRLILAANADILLIEDADITADAVTQNYLAKQQLWKPYSKHYQVDITTYRNIWIKLSLSNPYPVPIELFVVAAEPGMVDGQFILIKDNNITESWELGSHKVFSERPINHPYFLVPFTLEPGEQTTLLVAMHGIGYADRIWIEQQHTFWASYSLTSLSDGLFFGAMSILSLITLMLFLANRDRLYLYFALMIYGSLIYQLARTGYGFQLLWPDSANITSQITLTAVSIPMVGAILFSMRFLQLRADKRPWLFRISLAFLSLSIVTSLVALLAPLETSYSLVFITATAVTFYFLIIWLHAAHRAINKDRRAQFFAAAWLLYLLPYIFSSIYNLTNTDSPTVSFLDYRNGDVFFAIALLVALVVEARKVAADKQRAIADSEAKTQFLANMSHELRTPLNGVIGTGELLAQTEQTPSQKHYSEVIISSGKLLLRLINDILDLTKITEGKLEIEEKPFSLDQVLSDCMTSFMPTVFQKTVPLLNVIHPNMPLNYIGDEYRLRQIILNLLSNAMKFTEEGEVKVYANWTQEPNTPQGILSITVIDSGIGIEASKLDTIFLQFTQADISTTRRFGGSGLGLAISKAIVEQMGGSITAQSEPGKGSTFNFEIPIKVDIAREQDRLKHLEPLRGKNALVLVDYPHIMDAFCEHLISWEMNVDLVESPEMANEKLAEENNYDFIIATLIIDTSTPLEKIENRNIPLLLLYNGALNDSSSLWHEKTISLPVPIPLNILGNSLVNLLEDNETEEPQTLLANSLPKENAFNILIAEDNLINQTVVKRMLESLGNTVSIANNGLEAAAMSEESDYDIIFMDCEMPILDGYAASLKILSRKKSFTPTIIALTAHAMEGTEIKCLNAGMKKMLTKPVSMGQLKNFLEEIKEQKLAP